MVLFGDGYSGGNWGDVFILGRGRTVDLDRTDLFIVRILYNIGVFYRCVFINLGIFERMRKVWVSGKCFSICRKYMLYFGYEFLVIRLRNKCIYGGEGFLVLVIFLNFGDFSFFIENVMWIVYSFFDLFRDI